MNQNGKHISACMRIPEDEGYNTSVVPDCLEFVNNIFNLRKFDLTFIQSPQNKHSLGL